MAGNMNNPLDRLAAEADAGRQLLDPVRDRIAPHILERYEEALVGLLPIAASYDESSSYGRAANRVGDALNAARPYTVESFNRGTFIHPMLVELPEMDRIQARMMLDSQSPEQLALDEAARIPMTEAILLGVAGNDEEAQRTRLDKANALSEALRERSEAGIPTTLGSLLGLESVRLYQGDVVKAANQPEITEEISDFYDPVAKPGQLDDTLQQVQEAVNRSVFGKETPAPAHSSGDRIAELKRDLHVDIQPVAEAPAVSWQQQGGMIQAPRDVAVAPEPDPYVHESRADQYEHRMGL